MNFPMNRPLLFPVLMLLGLLAGCTTYDAKVERDRSLAGVQRYFVQSNPNDNHALDSQIAGALKARGLAAETGPLTMMPDETQAIVTYQDHWTWDFGDRLVYLQLTVREQKTGRNYATVTFSAKVPTGKALSAIVDELVGRMVPAGHP
jgi:hypothetical protein